jgi:hypothetical protein
VAKIESWKQWFKAIIALHQSHLNSAHSGLQCEAVKKNPHNPCIWQSMAQVLVSFPDSERTG